MRRTIAVACVLLALSWSGLALAEDKPTVAWIERVTPKPDSAAKLEEAARKHFAWHRAQNDTWAVFVWEVVTGENAGQYVVGSFGHTWKDIDAREAFDKADTENAMASVGPFMEAITPSIWNFFDEASRPTVRKEPAKFTQLTTYVLDISRVSHFTDAIKEIKVALDKASFPVHSSWYSLVSGGEGPQYAVAVERDSWADFAGPEKSMMKVLDEQLGGRKATELIDAVRESTRFARSEVLRYRPDMSYVPTK